MYIFDINTINNNSSSLGALVTMSWNNGIPAANFTITNNNTMNPIGTFSWAPTLADTANSPYFFTVNVNNQACPAPGTFSFQYQINVLGTTDMVATPTITNVSCNGGNDGIISVNTTGSLPPFSYSWSNGSTSTNINNLAVGTYNLQITDFGGCSLTQTYTITDPPANSTTIVSTDAGCNGNDGTAIVSVQSLLTGGTNLMYCNSGPGNSGYSNIELVNLIGDTTTINNNTSGLCDSTEDYTTMSAVITNQLYKLNSQVESTIEGGGVDLTKRLPSEIIKT